VTAGAQNFRNRETRKEMSARSSACDHGVHGEIADCKLQIADLEMGNAGIGPNLKSEI
jgi:hypothetical protein